VVARVRLVSCGRRGQAILLEQRKRTQVRVNEALVFDIPPFFIARGMDWLAQVEGGISARVGSGFGIGSI
jgi:hypothetical protein